MAFVRMQPRTSETTLPPGKIKKKTFNNYFFDKKYKFNDLKLPWEGKSQFIFEYTLPIEQLRAI